VDLLVIRDLLGHASVATTQVYAHVAKRRLREAIEGLEQPTWHAVRVMSMGASR